MKCFDLCNLLDRLTKKHENLFHKRKLVYGPEFVKNKIQISDQFKNTKNALTSLMSIKKLIPFLYRWT